MIDNDSHPVAWSLLVGELDDAREHLESLIGEMAAQRGYDEEEFRINLGHICAHLNRAWYSRGLTSEIPEDQSPVFSRFQTDVKPVG